MKKNVQHIIWIVVVVMLCYFGFQKFQAWQSQHDIKRHIDEQPPRFSAQVMMVGYVDEAYPGRESSGSLLRVGCDDVLIVTEIPLHSVRIASVLAALAAHQPSEGLHNALNDKEVSISGVQEEDGVLIVSLEGDLVFGGVCDLPRFKGQLEETIKLHHDGPFLIELNGSRG